MRKVTFRKVLEFHPLFDGRPSSLFLCGEPQHPVL